MPLIDAPDPYANPPRLVEPEPRTPLTEDPEVDDGYVLLRNVSIDGSLELGDCTELELIDCDLTGVALTDQPGLSVELVRCNLTTCDLSRVRAAVVNRSRFAGCKLIGTDFSGIALDDVIFRDCAMRYTNMRLSEFRRVAFTNCRMDEVDFYDSGLQHVSFDESELHEVIFDKARMERVDLRAARTLGITSVSDLTGALITNDQVIQLAYLFALASGISIERD